MFVRKRVERLEELVTKQQSAIRKLSEQQYSMVGRIERLEHQANKVKVPVVNEDGEQVTERRYHKDYPKTTLVAIEDVLESAFDHIGLRFSIERRDPDIIRIDDVMVNLVLTTGDGEDRPLTKAELDEALGRD